MPKQNKKSLLVPLSVIVLLAVALLYVYLGTEESVDFISTSASSGTAFKPTGVKVSYDYDSKPYFYSNGSAGFYFSTKDGISFINADGRSKWNYVYNFSQPTVKAAGDVVAVSEIKGRFVHVFNASGRLYNLEFDQPILYFAVNRLGYLIVQLKKDSDYQTRVYDTGGDLVFEYRHHTDNEYPITSEISGDGRIVVSNLLEVSGLYMSSGLSFSYTYGSSSTAFASRIKENQLITLTGFMENNNFVAVSDTEISAFSTGESNLLEELGVVTLNNRLSYFKFMGEKGFAFVLGQGLLNKPSEPENTIKIYDSSATETGSLELDKTVTYFHADKDAVIVGSYSSYSAISAKGRLLWEYVSPGELKQIIFVGNTDTVLMASGTEAGVYKRTRASSATSAAGGNTNEENGSPAAESE